MKFNSEDEAFDYWREEIYYGSGEGYVGRGSSFDRQVDFFKDWLEDNAVVWPDEPNRNLQD